MERRIEDISAKSGYGSAGSKTQNITAATGATNNTLGDYARVFEEEYAAIRDEVLALIRA